MGFYTSEQGADYGEDDAPLSEDLKPHLRREWGLDVFVSEFPYHQYAGVDFPPEDDEKVRSWMEHEWVDGLDDVPDSVGQKGPFRTDLVGVQVDRRALRLRISRTGNAEPLNQPGQGKRRYRRTFLTFVGDGPMTRDYWEQDHGGRDELRGYGEDSARRGFGWLKERNYLRPVGGQAWDAVDIPLHIHGRAHAFELKLERGEWTTALKQASRASVFADYRWVVYDSATAPNREDELETFRNNGIGLITVHPERGMDVVVWAEQCTPEVNRELLDRYMVERWDLNERVLSKLNAAHEPDRTGWPEDWTITEMFDVGADILGEIDPDSVEIDPGPPTANGFTAGRAEAAGVPMDSGDNAPLTAFTGDGDG